VTSAPVAPLNLHYVRHSPVGGLAVAERRVPSPEATVICVHGGLDRGGSFARLARRCAPFDVVAYDRRGYQRSRALAPLTLSDHIEDLVALTRREAQRGPVIYFGHSYGGVVALGASLLEPQLAKLVTVYEAPLPWILRRPNSRAPLTSDAAQEAEVFFRRVVSDQAWEHLGDAERESRHLDGPGLLSDLAILAGSAPYDLGQITTPSVYVHGDLNQVDYYRSLSLELEKVSPMITSRELVRAGHGAHLSNPDQLAELLHELWQDQCASP
jgi:pimeloyl-ACP methyl ester carboxylesterase